MKPIYLFSPGDSPAERTGKRFLKELLREGTYQHPVRPWPQPLVVNEAKIDELVKNTMSGFEHGVKVLFPITHNDGENPESNRGFFNKVFKARNSKGSLSLYGEVEVTTEDTAEQIGRDLRDVSVYINDFGSGTWAPDGQRIVHACITNYPVFSGQENFVALSAFGGVESTSRNDSLRLDAEPKKDRMKINDAIRNSAKSLGITLSGDELTEDALTAMLASAKPAEAKPVTEADIPKILSVDTKADKYFGAYRTQLGVSTEAEIVAAEKAGRLNKDMADACRTLLSVAHGFSLSADGDATKVDVPALVRKVLAGIPDRSIVPVTPDPKLSVGAAPPIEPKKFDSAELKAVAERMLSMGKAK